MTELERLKEEIGKAQHEIDLFCLSHTDSTPEEIELFQAHKDALLTNMNFSRNFDGSIPMLSIVLKNLDESKELLSLEENRKIAYENYVSEFRKE